MTNLAVIPKPVLLETTGGTWTLPDTPRVRLDTSRFGSQVNMLLPQHFSHLLPSRSAILTEASDLQEQPDLTLQPVHVPERYADEEYRLRIRKGRVTIEASTYSGFVWGIQTLGRILEEGSEVPCLVCHDYPRFRWRGLHLDVARHFFSVDFLFKYLRLLSRHKLNIFHWHLTDDQGWRLAIDSYPRLKEVGAWRIEADASRYGGYYTGDDIREIVAYARGLGITVVPEIDLPGHASALLAAYPELSCGRQPIEVPGAWGVFDNTLCPSRESTYRFIEGLLTNVVDRFDGPFVHIGGDECSARAWENHAACRDLMRRLRLRSVWELQGYFNRRVGGVLKSLERRLLGWDEILEYHPPPGSAVMCWRNTDHAVQAIKQGYEAVLCPTSHCYFDYYQALTGEPKAIGGHLPLERVYEFEPIHKGMDSVDVHKVLGGQGNVWTEYMESPEQVEYMTVPRVCALSEVLWSERESRQLDSFLRRLVPHLESLARAGYNYRPL